MLSWPTSGETSRPLLAKALFNAAIGAKAEDQLARRDALLEELRALHCSYPDDSAVREALDKLHEDNA